MGADPATILGAVTPVPDSLSEYAFAGLLRRHTEVAACIGQRPAGAGQRRVRARGPYPSRRHGTRAVRRPHRLLTNEVDDFPVFTIDRITHRDDPIYHSTYTGRPPDEPAILASR